MSFSMVDSSSGGRTRTPNDRARTCCVADYTTPERWPRRAAPSYLPTSGGAESFPCDAQPFERALAAEQPDRVEEWQPLRATFHRRVERGHHLARLYTEFLERGAQVDVLHRPVTRLHV